MLLLSIAISLDTLMALSPLERSYKSIDVARHKSYLLCA
jgi:hypothetical protein